MESLLQQLLGKLPRCLAPTLLLRYFFTDKNLKGKKSLFLYLESTRLPIYALDQ